MNHLHIHLLQINHALHLLLLFFSFWFEFTRNFSYSRSFKLLERKFSFLYFWNFTWRGSVWWKVTKFNRWTLYKENLLPTENKIKLLEIFFKIWYVEKDFHDIALMKSWKKLTKIIQRKIVKMVFGRNFSFIFGISVGKK